MKQKNKVVKIKAKDKEKIKFFIKKKSQLDFSDPDMFQVSQETDECFLRESLLISDFHILNDFSF